NQSLVVLLLFTGDNKPKCGHTRAGRKSAQRFRMIRSSNRNVEQSVSRRENARISQLNAVDFREFPLRIFGNAANKTLAAKQPLTIDFGRRQSHIVFDPSFMLSRRGKLEDFGTGFAFEHSMPDLRRLKNTVTRLEPKRLAMALINDTNSPAKTVDQLKIDLMIMDVARNRGPTRSLYVRRD